MPYERQEDPMPFENGTTVMLETIQSEKGYMAVARPHAENPFNHGGEVQDRRLDIADEACKRLGCEPNQLNYAEQEGQHWTKVTLDRGTDGTIKELTRSVYSNDKLQADINIHEATKDLGQEQNHSPSWSQDLKNPGHDL